MKIRALVVSDHTEERKNKEGAAVTYRTVSVVDQDPDGASLESMVKIGISLEDQKAGAPGTLAGNVITCRIRGIQDDWRGLSFKADLVSVDGTMSFTPAQKKQS